MKPNFNTKLFGWFYHTSCRKELQKRFGINKKYKCIQTEYNRIIGRAKDIGPSKLMCSYCMGAYFIALQRVMNMPAEECYEIFKDGLYANQLFHKALGTADSYLDPQKLPGRKKWSEESHLNQYENDWIVDILDQTDTYDLETIRDLHANNAGKEYMKGLDGKIKAVEKHAIFNELTTAAFVSSAQMLLKLGIASVALVGGVLLANGSLDILTFSCFCFWYPDCMTQCRWRCKTWQLLLQQMCSVKEWIKFCPMRHRMEPLL